MLPGSYKIEDRGYESPCHIWQGYVRPDTGYAVTSSGPRRKGNRAEYAHRKAWREANGPIPSSLEVHHKCEVKACVRVDHLELVGSMEHQERHRRTHCKRGHELSLDNVYVYPPTGRARKPTRHCKTCILERGRERRIAMKNRAKSCGELD